MNKQEFLARLRKGLAGLPHSDIEERLAFYSEMIDDRMEEGLSEEDAVAAVGPVESLVALIIAETPFVKIAKERARPKKRLSTGEIALLALGSPIWLSLAIAAGAVILSLYAVLWSVIISLWAVFVTFICCGFGGIAAGIAIACIGNGLTGIAILGAGLICLGLSVFTFYGCKAATKGTAVLAKKFTAWIKRCFVNKEAV